MPIGQSLLAEFDQEMAGTRRVLERVPSDKGDWKPHPKSFSMAHLAQLVAWMPGWFVKMLKDTSLDLLQSSGYSNQSTEELLRMFDENVRTAREALSSTPDSAWGEMWSLKRGDMVVWSGARTEVVRNTINHLIHHRAQLTVYLRLNDIPVPSLYGPSADERPF